MRSLVAVLSLVTSMLFYIPVTSASCLPGDIMPDGGDGVVTVADVVKALRATVSLDTLSAYQSAVGDVVPIISVDTSVNPDWIVAGGDDVIDIGDVVVMLRRAVDLNTLHWPARNLRLENEERSNDLYIIVHRVRLPACIDVRVDPVPGVPNISVSSERIGSDLRIVIISTAGTSAIEPMDLTVGQSLVVLTYFSGNELHESDFCVRSSIGYTSLDGLNRRSLAGLVRIVESGNEGVGPDTTGVTLCGDVDLDGDLVPDDLDNCTGVANADQLDTDSDLVGDVCDNCPAIVNTNQTNADSDGAGDACDTCPADPNKVVPGVCGCGVANVDSDGDTTADCNDQCPADPAKVIAGTCGCGVSDADTDGDGRPNCLDNCPADPNKSDRGICGCGVSDVDTDSDGFADCNDLCPNDPLKFTLGTCGCGVADGDQDGDGRINCQDNCPALANPLQENGDSDSFGDACDNCRAVANADQADADSDGLGDVCEASYSSSASDPDTDDDGLSDGAEVYGFGSNPANQNTDGDGWNDGYEVLRYGLSPTHYDLDQDRDGFPEPMEVQWAITNRFGADLDTDGDGFPDIVETQISMTDPNDSASWPRPGV